MFVSKAEQELEQSENRYRSLVEQASEGICLLTSEGEVMDANPSLGRILGCSPGELKGSRIKDWRLGATLEKDGQDWAEPDYPEAGTLTAEWRVVRTDGQKLTLEGTRTRLPNGEFLVIVRDITERRRLEREIIEISRREAQKVARQMYDLLAQQLAGIGFLTKVLEQRLQALDLTESGQATRIRELVRETMRQTRDLAEGLCPLDFTADGLATALSELCTSISSSFNIPCRFVAAGRNFAAEPGVATQLYLICREAVTAAAKEGTARELLVRLESGADTTILSLEYDNGGLDSCSRICEKSLRLIRHRASLLGGRVTVEKGAVTVIRCILQRIDK